MEFINKELQELDKKAQPIIAAHLKRLDDLSKDIKSLDNLFDKSGCIDEFSLEIDEGVLYFDQKRHKVCFQTKLGDIDKPLIECPLHIRFIVAPYLSEFLENFIYFINRIINKDNNNG
jgi:hypothetical protein